MKGKGIIGILERLEMQRIIQVALVVREYSLDLCVKKINVFEIARFMH